MSSNVFHRRLDREPLHAVRTQGNYIYLEDGRKLLDGGVSAAVTSIGYGDKRVIEGIVDQLQTVPFAHSGTFTSKVGYLEEQSFKIVVIDADADETHAFIALIIRDVISRWG